jgi:ABC-type thiamin/hydroxymethylpyrimidine transport system permease subunit
MLCTRCWRILADSCTGLLVDLGFLLFRNKDSLAAYSLAAGLASASNVLVFQLFASVPADTLAYWAMLLVAGVALLSGVLFAGVLSRGLLNALRRAGFSSYLAEERECIEPKMTA